MRTQPVPGTYFGKPFILIIIDMISLCLFYDALITAWLQK